MDFVFWYTVLVLGLLLIALLREIAPIEILLFGALLALVIGGVLPLEAALQGFAHPVLLTLGALFLIASALQATGMLRWLGIQLLRKSYQTPVAVLARIAPVSALFSAFLSNTVVVATFLPLLKKWARRYDQPLSLYLIPLSYATIVGGMCTLVGTSTNLFVDGYVRLLGSSGFALFDFAIVGFPLLVVVVIYLLWIAPKLLPRHRHWVERLKREVREFVVEAEITPQFPFIGKTVEQAGLRHLQGVFLFQIERQGRMIAPVTPDERLCVGDRLFFTGVPDTIMDLQQIPGIRLLSPAGFPWEVGNAEQVRLFEVVISPSSPLIGKTVRESQFRTLYDAAILAIHRNGERVREKIGNVVLQPGDTLLLVAPPEFQQRWYYSPHFYLVSETKAEIVKPGTRGYAVVAFFLLALGVAAAGWVPLALAVAVAALGAVLVKAIPISEAKHVVDWSVLLIVGAALGLAEAIDRSGIAMAVAQLFVPVIQSDNVWLLLVGLFVLTNVLTEMMTNIAAAAVVLPIAITVANAATIPLIPLAMIVAVAASSSFATPIGYQTNLMVYGPGNYRFVDFLRVGLPLNVLSAVVSSTIVYWWFFV